MTVTPTYTPVTPSHTVLLKAGGDTTLWVSLPSPGPTSTTKQTTPPAQVTSRLLHADLQIFDGAGVMIHNQPVDIIDNVTGPWVNQQVTIAQADSALMIPRIAAGGGTGRWQVVARCGDVVIGCGDVQAVGAGGGPNWAVPKPCVGCSS